MRRARLWMDLIWCGLGWGWAAVGWAGLGGFCFGLRKLKCKLGCIWCGLYSDGSKLGLGWAGAELCWVSAGLWFGLGWVCAGAVSQTLGPAKNVSVSIILLS